MPFRDAKSQHLDYLLSSVPKTLISTHGLSVGLPEGQMGNSESGTHDNLVLEECYIKI